MIKCIKCGKELEDGMEFCNECGTKVKNGQASTASKTPTASKVSAVGKPVATSINNTAKTTTTSTASKSNSNSTANKTSSVGSSGNGVKTNGTDSESSTDTKDEASQTLSILAIISGALGIIFWGIGFYKCLAYASGESYPYDAVNAYVGGDAYNYIINGTYFTAYAVIGGVLILSSVILYGFSVINKTLRKQV